MKVIPTKVRLLTSLKKAHFILLTLTVTNLLFKYLTPYSLMSSLASLLGVLVILSGLLLFFLYWKPFKSVNLYFSIYLLGMFLLVAGFIVRGIFAGLVLSILLFPITPDAVEYEQEGILISTPFQGLMAACCTYQVKERKLLLFEKKQAVFGASGLINFETMKITLTEKEITLTYALDSNNELKEKRIVRE
ncbi:MAG: hypothetical protein ACFB0B_09680 [Thermonemataceae bacterium]